MNTSGNKKVDTIYPGYISACNGAANLLKKLKENYDSFSRLGVDLRIVSLDFYSSSSCERKSVIHLKTSFIKKLIRYISKYSIIITYLRMYRSGNRPAKLILDYYDRIEDKGSVVVFHDKTTCYEYLTRKQFVNQKVILVSHDSGDFWSMQYLYMPRLKSVLFNRYRKKFEQTIIEGCAKIGFDSDIARRNFCLTYKYDASRTFYVYNGVDRRPCPHRHISDKLKLICVATLNNRKNQMGMLNAIGLLSQEYRRKIEVILVGDGPSYYELELKARSIGVKILFTGSSSEDVYYDYLVQSNCFFLYSKSEGLPIAIIEAMRAGLPIIGSDIAGIPEQIVDGKTGYIVPLDDRILSKKLVYIIDNIKSLPELGANSYNLFLERFTTESMIRKYANVFLE